MSCASNNARRPRAASTGYTLLEILVALMIMMIFLGGVYTTFVQISKAHRASDARMEAVRNARAAMATMGEEIKGANRVGSEYYFVGIDATLPYGDGIDNDRDGKIDEEFVNGKLDDTPTTSSLDRHAKLGSLYERPLMIGTPSLGDAEVDVDAKYGRDILIFKVTPKVPTPEMEAKVVTYSVTDYEGQANVLVRQTEIFPSVGDPVVSQAPLAFGVAGLDLLYWDPNAQPVDQGWVASWDSRQSTAFALPRLPLPAAVYIRLSMIADARPQASLVMGQAMDVITMETIVNIEEILNDAQYPRPRL